MIKSKKIVATFAVIIAQVIFGFSFMFVKIALNYASPMTLIANRYFVASVGLTVVLLVTKQKLKIGKNIWKLILMSLFQPVLYFIFETYGILMTTSSFSSIMISLVSIVSMMCGVVMLKEKPSVMQYAFAALSVLGVAMATNSGKEDGIVTPLGFVLLLGAVFAAAGYNILSRKISNEYSAFERTYAMAIMGLVWFSGIAVVENFGKPILLVQAFTNSSYVFAILFLGVASSVIAFMFLNFANTNNFLICFSKNDFNGMKEEGKFVNFAKPSTLSAWMVGVKFSIMFEMPKPKHCNCLQNNVITPWNKKRKDRGIE